MRTSLNVIIGLLHAEESTGVAGARLEARTPVMQRFPPSLQGISANGCSAIGRRWFAFAGLLLLLAVAGCADATAESDSDKRGVFYGGLSGGHAWP